MTSTRRLVVSYVVALTIIAGWSALSFGELRTFLNRQQDVAETPIVALAANAMKGDEERCLLAAGMRADTQTASQPQRTVP